MSVAKIPLYYWSGSDAFVASDARQDYWVDQTGVVSIGLNSFTSACLPRVKAYMAKGAKLGVLLSNAWGSGSYVNFPAGAGYASTDKPGDTVKTGLYLGWLAARLSELKLGLGKLQPSCFQIDSELAAWALTQAVPADENVTKPLYESLASIARAYFGPTLLCPFYSLGGVTITQTVKGVYVNGVNKGRYLNSSTILNGSPVCYDSANPVGCAGYDITDVRLPVVPWFCHTSSFCNGKLGLITPSASSAAFEAQLAAYKPWGFKECSLYPGPSDKTVDPVTNDANLAMFVQAVNKVL